MILRPGGKKRVTDSTEPPPAEPIVPAAPIASAQRTAALFRTVLGESALAMAATEGEAHRVSYANSAFCRLVGDDEAEVLGRPLTVILASSGLSDTVPLLDRVYSAGGAASLAVFREGGIQADMHATYAAWRMPAEHDRPAGLLVQVIDTSRQAQAAEELREVNRRLLQAGLDAEVRAETHVTLNSELRATEARLQLAAEEQAALLAAVQRAYAQAETALRVRDEFLGIAAHELRSPLTAIKGTAQMAARALDRGTADSNKIRAQIDLIVAASARLEALLTDLLEVSRMRAEGLSAKVHQMDLAALAVTVARRHQSSVDQAAIVCEVPTHPVYILGDVGRLEQVLDNLLSNAVKYSPNGSTVTLRLRTGADGVVLTVQDRGIGVPVDEVERIFEPFRRASNALKHKVPGVDWDCTSVVRSRRFTMARLGPKATARGRVRP